MEKINIFVAKSYSAPLLEIVEVGVEQGFATSFSATHDGFTDDWDPTTTEIDL